jgi:dihydrofolate synthase/folylpolyglutamate synthase
MAPLVDHWHFTDLPMARAARAQNLAECFRDLALAGPGGASQTTLACHEQPQRALDAALEVADPADRIVVFGSFHTVGGVLQNGVPRLTGKHSA